MSDQTKTHKENLKCRRPHLSLQNSKTIPISYYVDDIIITATRLIFLKQLRPLDYFLGIEVKLLGITVLTAYNSLNCLHVSYTALGTINTQPSLYIECDSDNTVLLILYLSSL